MACFTSFVNKQRLELHNQKDATAHLQQCWHNLTSNILSVEANPVKLGNYLLTTQRETPEDAASIHYVNQEIFGHTEESEIIRKLRY